MAKTRTRRFTADQKSVVTAFVLGTIKDQIESGEVVTKQSEGRNRYVIKFRESENHDWETYTDGPKSFASLEGAEKYIAELVENEDELHADLFEVKQRTTAAKSWKTFQCPHNVEEIATQTNVGVEEVRAIVPALNKKFEEKGMRVEFKRMPTGGGASGTSLDDILSAAGISIENL